MGDWLVITIITVDTAVSFWALRLSAEMLHTSKFQSIRLWRCLDKVPNEKPVTVLVMFVMGHM